MLSSSVKILQVNLNRNPSATKSALKTAIELKADLIVIQEPWVTDDNACSIAHQSFTQILPPDNDLCPRTLVYVSKAFRPLVSLGSSSPRDSDLLAIDIIEGNAKIQLLMSITKLTKLESALGPLNIVYSTNCYLQTPFDFSTHYPWWNPLAKKTPGANQLMEWLEQQDLQLRNSPDTGTFFWPHLARESVLYFTFASSTVASTVEVWQVLPNLGSDYHGLLFSISGTKTELSAKRS
jgi:hypothetical protein